jgi:pimeloyl-ACP methyl ester carboxylesterase
MAQVILLHGWLGSSRTFGALPEILESDGHRLLPIFRQYPTSARRQTLEQLAHEFEAEFSRPRPDGPVVVVAHSMGGLLIRAWMLRYYAARGKRPPVERVIECCVPRHGIHLEMPGRLAVRWGCVPGSGLARQMLCPNPLLWDLAWSELEHAALLPPVVAFTGLAGSASMASMLAGGRESDGVVPAALSQPNARYVRAGQPVADLPRRAFRLFAGYRHSGRRGLLAHMRFDRTGHLAETSDETCAALRLAVRGDEEPLRDHGLSSRECLARAFLIVRHEAGRAVEALELSESGKAEGKPARPAARHPDGLALFALHALRPGAPAVERLRVRCDGREWDSPSAGLTALRGGEVCYLDLRTQ